MWLGPINALAVPPMTLRASRPRGRGPRRIVGMRSDNMSTMFAAGCQRYRAVLQAAGAAGRSWLRGCVSDECHRASGSKPDRIETFRHKCLSPGNAKDRQKGSEATDKQSVERGKNWYQDAWYGSTTCEGRKRGARHKCKWSTSPERARTLTMPYAGLGPGLGPSEKED